MVIFYHVLHGLGLMALTVFVHAKGSLYFLWSLARQRPYLNKHKGLVVSTLLLTWVVGTLVFLHILEIAGWGFYYYWMGLFPDFETAAYYSLVTYTTVGYGDVVLPREWRLMGTSEALVGIMMTAWSTALLFGVVNRFHDRVLERFMQGRPFPPG